MNSKTKKIEIYIYYSLTRDTLDTIFTPLLETKRLHKNLDGRSQNHDISKRCAILSFPSSSRLSAGLKVDCPRERSYTRWGPVFQITPRAKKNCSWNDVRLLMSDLCGGAAYC